MRQNQGGREGLSEKYNLMGDLQEKQEPADQGRGRGETSVSGRGTSTCGSSDRAWGALAQTGAPHTWSRAGSPGSSLGYRARLLSRVAPPDV